MTRLYVGVFNLIQRIGSTQTIVTERYINWEDSAESAKGKWLGHAMGKNPGYSVVGAFVDDVTEIAGNRPDD